MRYVLLVLILLSHPAAAAQAKHFVQKDSCWGEGTSEDPRWTAQKDIPLYSVPATREKPKRIGVIKVGAEFAIAGCDVEGFLGHLVVRRSEGPFQPGDDVWLHTYVGEGWWEVTINGKRSEFDLRFSAWDEVKAQACLEPECWAILDVPVRFTEWFAVTSTGGQRGWIKDTDR